MQARTVGLLSAHPAADPRRLILIDGPPLSQPEGQALALYVGQVVLVAATGPTPRGVVATALERPASDRTKAVTQKQAAAADRPTPRGPR